MKDIKIRVRLDAYSKYSVLDPLSDMPVPELKDKGKLLGVNHLGRFALVDIHSVNYSQIDTLFNKEGKDSV